MPVRSKQGEPVQIFQLVQQSITRVLQSASMDPSHERKFPQTNAAWRTVWIDETGRFCRRVSCRPRTRSAAIQVYITKRATTKGRLQSGGNPIPDKCQNALYCDPEFYYKVETNVLSEAKYPALKEVWAFVVNTPNPNALICQLVFRRLAVLCGTQLREFGTGQQQLGAM